MLFMTTTKMHKRYYVFQRKLETKSWQLLLTGTQVLMIGLVHILSDKEEEDRIEYTCITPKWTLEEEDEEEEEEDEKEDTHIRLLVQPTDELLSLIGDDNNIANEAIR